MKTLDSHDNGPEVVKRVGPTHGTAALSASSLLALFSHGKKLSRRKFFPAHERRYVEHEKLGSTLVGRRVRH